VSFDDNTERFTYGINLLYSSLLVELGHGAVLRVEGEGYDRGVFFFLYTSSHEAMQLRDVPYGEGEVCVHPLDFEVKVVSVSSWGIGQLEFNPSEAEFQGDLPVIDRASA